MPESYDGLHHVGRQFTEVMLKPCGGAGAGDVRAADAVVRGAAVHMNSAFFDVRLEVKKDQESGLEETADVKKALRLADIWDSREDAYFKQQMTRPQTLGYGVSDSPVGLMAWLFEKCVLWAEPGAESVSFLSKDWRGCLNID